MNTKKDLPAKHITNIDHLRILLAESYRHNDYLQQQVDELKRKRFWNFNGEECWSWDSEGDNYLDSLVCPVVISAQEMRLIRDKAKTLVAAVSGVAQIAELPDLVIAGLNISRLESDLLKAFCDSDEQASNGGDA